jgi:hypothetical protein
MAYGSTHPAETHHPDTGFHVVAWILSLLGLLAAAVGLYFELAPTDATMEITLFSNTWTVSELADSWSAVLLIVGGAVMGLAMAAMVSRDIQDDDTSRWLVWGEGLLTLIGVAALVFGIVLAL